MEEKSISEIKQSIKNGHLEGAIRQLYDISLSKDLEKQLTSISVRYQKFQIDCRKGLLSYEQETLERNRIVSSLIDLVNHLNKIPLHSHKKNLLISSTFLFSTIILLLSLAFYYFFNFFDLFSKDQRTAESLHLTVLVEDAEGNVVLQNEGRLTIDFGNDRRIAEIGENGRTNFGEIPAKFKDSVIQIGFEAEGYEMVRNSNEFFFKGEPIRLEVKKNLSLRKISGVVKDRSGDKLIEGAIIMIENDTVTFSNEFGIFSILLPEEMEVEDKNAPYRLHISKEGFYSKTLFYYPRLGNVEIRLNKK